MNDDALLLRHGFAGATHVATGGAARVYRLADVALKVVDEPLAGSLADEARVLRSVGPPVVPAVREHHHRVLALEWLDGVTLQQWLRQALQPGDRWRMAVELARTLAVIHARGVVHRDVKASNVMITRDGPRWFDFGLAVELGRGTQVAARQGTRTTMAPEAWTGAAPSPRTDVYSLGVLSFEVLTGRAPFSGDAAALEFAHRQERAPVAGLGPALDDVLARALEKDPAARFADAGELEAALRRARAGSTAPARGGEDGGRERARRTQPQPKDSGPDDAEIALVALRSDLGPKALAARFGAIGAVWVGGQLFAHPHPLGPAHGLAQLDALARELTPDFTLHVAPLRVRVRSLSVRISGPAVERPDWAVPGPGRSLTADAVRHFTAPRAAAPDAGELDWLDDGTRLAPIEAALARSPALVWVKAPPGSGRTRLLAELARRLAARGGGTGDVLLVDDAERLGWQQWEWLEALTTPGHATPTDVVLVGDERLTRLRPHLGSRAAHFSVVEPSLLSDDEARRLVRALLAPAEMLPDALVHGLADAAGGLAGELAESIQVLKRRGLLARDVRTGEWRLSSDVRALRAGGRAGAEALRELPSALHDLARLLALAAWALDAAALDDALRALPDAFGARKLDAGAALAQLVANGLGALDRRGRFEWSRHGVRRALAAEAGPRVAQLHRALAVAAQRHAPVDALAHHAHAAGWTDEAARASAEAGLAALRGGDAIGADLFLTRALEHQPAPALRLARARARRQLERFADAIADARAVTGSLRVAARLEASLSFDWMNEFAQANEESERALEEGAAFEGTPTPLGRELRLARGRLHVRAGRWAEALEVLAPLCDHAPSPEEVETILGAHALAASVCCVLGELPRAERLFAAGLALADRHGQPVVGCALLINRPMLWMALARVDDALGDLRSAAMISRRLGHAQIERVASHNLAQYLVWLGRLDEAHALAARAEQLAAVRLGGEAPSADQLLLARIELARDDRRAAREHLARVAGRELNPSEALQRDVVRAWLGELDWSAVLDEREGVVPDELLDAARLAERFAADDAVKQRAAARCAALRPSASVTHGG